MKTILKVTLMFAFVAFVNSLFAIGNLKLDIVPVSTGKALVTISSVNDSNLKITVKDKKGETVYYKETSSTNNDYKRLYDFSDLEDGSYNLSVVSNDITTERTFQKEHGNISVGEEKTTLEPYFGYEDGILRCTYLNFSKENMELHFYSNNQLIYTKNIGTNFKVVEALNLSKLHKGNYAAILTSGDKEFTYNFNIN